MSKYGHESGTLKIPTKAWKPLRDALVASWNERQAAAFAVMTRAHARLLEMKKASARGKFNPREALNQLLMQASGSCAIAREAERLGLEDHDFETSLVKPTTDASGRITGYTLRSPLKKDFPSQPASKATRFDAGYSGSIHLDAKAHTVAWHVSENNHAVEAARESFMGVVFFKLLDKITWGRGSGGQIVGNDEYNRDDDSPGGGGNYVTAEYGYAAQKRKDEAAKAARSRYGSGYSSYGSRYR